jgi:hypothetical protein
LMTCCLFFYGQVACEEPDAKALYQILILVA